MSDLTLAETKSALSQRHGSNAGQPLTRREGVLKVTGAARFAADHHPEGLLHAVMAVSTIARGRVIHLDVAAAKAHPGVVEVMTTANAPALAKSPDAKDHPFMFRLNLLQDNTVRYAGQAIAVVIGETLEAAAEGALLLAPRYAEEQARVGLEAGEAFPLAYVGAGAAGTEGAGDFEAGLADAAAKIESVYETPPQYHNPMEPHVCIAEWTGGQLKLETPSQGMAMAQGRIAGLFGIKPSDIHINSPYLGGGFGAKGMISGPQILAIMAAKLTGRPVKLALRRDQMFGPVGHRGATRQTLRLGADTNGALTALGHHTLTSSSSFDDFFENASVSSRHLYAAGAIATSHAGVRNDIGTPLFMRAPGEASGSAALESAIDELAHELHLDPLEFRLRNYADIEPLTGKPYSSKALRECYAQGAARFGWDKRPLEPRRMRDGDGLLTGWGMGTALFPALMFQGEARALLRADGTARVEIGAQDMGQGAWTALAQVAADGLGVDIDALEFEIGRSDLPNAGIAGGSAHTATAGNAIHRAGEGVIEQMTALAVNDANSPLFGAGNRTVKARGGRLFLEDDESRGETFQAILKRAGRAVIEAKGSASPDPTLQQTYAMHAHGAVFAEVKVDPALGQIRVTRLVGAFAAGRILNPRMVRSQYYGGMIWGVSFALHEHALLDPRTGRIMNANFADYHVPVNADIPSLEAILVEEHDPHVNALGVKGVGEIGITGTAGAIANAIWHATGVRVRTFPITLDKLLI